MTRNKPPSSRSRRVKTEIRRATRRGVLKRHYKRFSWDDRYAEFV